MQSGGALGGNSYRQVSLEDGLIKGVHYLPCNLNKFSVHYTELSF